MSLKEDIEKVETKIKEVEQNSFALELLKDYKKANKRLFIIILVILGMWLATIGGFLYYINTIDYVEDIDYKYAETDDGGNACVGDNCNNGEINYGESSSN